MKLHTEQVFSLLSTNYLTTDEVAHALGLTTRQTLSAVGNLRDGGLVERKDAGTNAGAIWGHVLHAVWTDRGDTWTHESDAFITEAWLTGRSYTEISAQMSARIGSAVSRNAVCGRLTRLGVMRDKPKREPRRERRIRLQKVKAMPTVVKPNPPPEGAQARLWITRKSGECAFPVGGDGADTLSCCTPCGIGTYCAEHVKVMHVARPANERLSRLARLA